jgi:hypothetical protein
MVIGILDYVTGYEIGFFIFYFIPVAITSWCGGRRKGLLIATAAAICWYLSDLYTFHPYSKAYLIYWETFMRFASFITTALTVSQIREVSLNQSRLEQALEEALEENRSLRELLKGVEVNEEDR